MTLAIDVQILRKVEEALNEVYEREFSRPSIPWASSLPICPRRYGFEQTHDAIWQTSYKKDFYSGIGTHLHTSLQTALAQAGLLWGNFKHCGLFWEDTWGNFRCPVCNQFPYYVEYATKEKVSGRCDGIVPLSVVLGLPDFGDAVLEIKSKSSSAVDKMEEPQWEHWTMQASSYVDLLKPRFPQWNIKHIIMLYVSRESPRKYKVFLTPAVPNIANTMDTEWKNAQAMFEAGKLGERICKTAKEGQDRYCDFAGMCFSPDVDVQWKRLLKEKREGS